MNNDSNEEEHESVTIECETVEEKDAYCWGNNSCGELGTNETENEQLLSPKDINFSSKIIHVSCGESHSVFLLEDGTLWTCGSNDHGQLGHTKRGTGPEKVMGLEGRTIIQVKSGYAHTVAIDIWGTCYSWGSNSHGQLGLNTNEKILNLPKMVKQLAFKTIIQIATGNFHTLMLTNTGELYACGSNSHGQLGLGISNGVNQIIPIQIEFLVGLPLLMITAGGFHSFALSVSGSVFGWGKNNLGQLGISDNEDKYKPNQLVTLRSLAVKYITAGIDHSVFLTKDGGVFTCGNGTYGQLGHSQLSSEILPRKILEFGAVVVQVATGRSHTLCLTDKGKLYSFGLNSSGQLGLGHTVNQKSPSPVNLGNVQVHSIYAGGDQSFILGYPVTNMDNIRISSVLNYGTYAITTQILSITEDLVKQMCSSVEPIDLDVMKNVETIFASPACWNNSFLLPNEEHIPTTWKSLGINLPQGGEILARIESMKATGLWELLDQVILKDLLPKLPHQLKHVELLRVYVLLPLLPTFYIVRTPVVQVLYADRIQFLHQSSINVIILWLFKYPIEYLERLISIYKRIVLMTLDSANQSKQQVLFSVS